MKRIQLLSLITILMLALLLIADTALDLLIGKYNNSDASERYSILTEVEDQVRDLDPDTVFPILNGLLTVTSDDANKAKIQNLLGDTHYRNDNIEKAIGSYNLALELLQHRSPHIEEGYALYDIASVYDAHLNYRKALEYYQLAEKVYSDLGDISEQASLINRIGLVYEALLIYDEALRNYFRALLMYESISDDEGIANSYVNIGNIYQTISKFDRALDYYQQALNIYRTENDDYGISSCLNNIGIIYYDLGEFNKALSYYQESLQYDLELDDKEGISALLNNIGIVYHELGEFLNSLDYYQRSLELSLELDDKWAIANTMANIGELYIDYEDYSQGLDYLNGGMQISEEFRFNDLLMEGYKVLAKYYNIMGDFEKAYFYYRNYVGIKDSLYVEASERIQEIQTIFETQKHRKEIEFLGVKQMHGRNIRTILVISAVILLFITIWLIIINKNKKKEIFKRKKLEKHILRLAHIVNQAEESIIMTDLNGNIQYVNKFFEKLTGYTSEEVLGRNPNILKSGFIDKKTYQELWETINTGQVWKGVFLNKKKNGDLYFEDAVIFPIKDEKGHLINFAAVKKDISDQIKQQDELKASELRFRTMARKIRDGLMIIENDQIVYTNDKLQEITGYDLKELKQEDLLDIIAPPDKERMTKKLADVRKDPEKIKSIEFWITRKNGEERFLSCGISYNRIDKKQTVIYVIVSDITERKISDEKVINSLKEKEILIKEIHHRVKNNMQVVSSLLQLQSRYITDPDTLELFKKSQNRVRSMALIHEKLYRSDDLIHIDFRDYIRKLSNSLLIFYTIDVNKIHIKYDIDDIYLDVNQAIPAGLIINELVSNSLKYAFKESGEGEIRISMKRDKDNIILKIKDNGIGIPDDFNYKNSDSLGLQLVNSLTEQLHGTLKMTGKKGASFILRFKEFNDLSHNSSSLKVK